MSVSPLNPPPSLLVKLGSIARHAEELLGPGAHPFDAQAIESLIADPEVLAWMAAADALALLPVTRSADSHSTGGTAATKETT